MKKNYEAPCAEKMEFNYQDQVVVASSICKAVYVNTSDEGGSGCDYHNTQIDYTKEVG